MPTYETLNTLGVLFTQTGVEVSVIVADFGDGFRSAALTGDPAGVRFWNIRIDVLPDTGPDERAQYLWDFFMRSKSAGNQPFWVEDVKAPRLYLAEFVDNTLTFEVLCAKVYSTGLALRQRRVEGVISPVDLFAPGAPDNVSLDVIDDSHIDVAFSLVANALSYKIERKTAAGSYVEIAANVTSLPYHDSGLAPLTEYFYRVRAHNTAGDSDYSDAVSATTPQSAIPTAPSSLSALGVSSSQITLNWTDNSNNESGFKIERKSPAGSFAEVAQVGADVVTWSDTGLTADTSYVYRSRAYSGAGNSAFSNEAPASTLSPAFAPVLYASFFQPDDTDTLPDADTGQTPTVVSTAGSAVFGTFRYQAKTNATGTASAVYECGEADGILLLRAENPSTTLGFALRYDGTDWVVLRMWGTQWDLSTYPVGTTVDSGSLLSAISAGDWLEVDFVGSTITIKKNGVTQDTSSISTNLTATKHGHYADNLTGRVKHCLFLDQAPTADHVFVTNPVPGRGRQRNASNKGSIPVEGVYSGSPLGIEGRFNGGVWQALTFGGGTFSGVLNDLPAGQGWLEVRFTNNHDVIWRVPAVGIGDVWGVIGQSNAVGALTEPQFFSHASLRAGVFDRGTASPTVQMWREAWDPTDTESGGGNNHSVWPLLSTSYMAEAGVPVYFLTLAHGQTGQFGDGATWAVPAGSTYVAAKNAVIAADPGGLKGLLWYGNESDARGEPGTQANLEAALKALRAQFSTDLGFGELEMWVTQISSIDSTIFPAFTRSTIDLVRLAQTNVVNSDSHLHVGPILYDIDTSTGGLADGIHITAPADGVKVAQRWWHMLKKDLFGGSEGRGPRFDNATKIDSTHIDVAFTLSGSAALMAGAPPTTGWRVVDGNGVRTVTGTARQNNTTVRLTLDQALSGSVTISWASFNDARGQVFTDNTSDAMPVEPFVNQSVA